MKNILYVFMLVCSLFIIACDSGGSDSNGPLSGGCTTEAAEGTWEMAENLYEVLANKVNEMEWDIKDLNREINY